MKLIIWIIIAILMPLILMFIELQPSYLNSLTQIIVDFCLGNLLAAMICEYIIFLFPINDLYDEEK